MTVVTANVQDVAARPDNTVFIFRSAFLREYGDSIVTPKTVRTFPVGGVLSEELEPGLVEVVFLGKSYLIEVPDDEDPVDLWDLIAAPVVFPNETRSADVAVAVDAYIRRNPLSGLGAASLAQVEAKYTKPTPGIPSTDLAADVQSAISEAVSAVQPAEVGTIVTAQLAADGTVAAAAASAAGTAVTAAVSGLDIVQRSDPGIPRTKSPESTSYIQMWMGPNGEFIRGDRVDGSVEIQRALLNNVQIAGGTTKSVDAEGITWAPYLGPSGPDDRIPEICLDKGGNVPQFALDRWKTRMGLGSVGGPVDIWITAGQSNATQLSAATSVYEPPLADVLEWNGTTFVPLSGVPWLGSGLVRRYAELYGRPLHRAVVVVRAAVGSTGFVGDDPTWDRTKTGAAVNLYAQMISKAQAALAASPAGSRIVGVAWAQGENDRYLGLGAYQAKLDDLIAHTRTDLGISDLPFVISSLTPDLIRYGLSVSDTAAQSMNAILEDTPRRVLNTSFVFGPEGMADPKPGENGIHWSSVGQTLRGKWFAEFGYDQARLNIAPTTTAQLLPPSNIRISRSAGTATIEWDSPTGRITSFTLETCVDGVGTTWTTETLTNPLTHIFTKSVASGTPIWARMKSNNSESGLSSLTSKEVRK